MKNRPEKRIGGTTFFWGLARRGLLFHWRRNALLCAGCAVCAAIIVGALLVGPSLRGSLRELHTQRLGGVRWALCGADGRIRASIADSIGKYLAVKAAPVQLLSGNASAMDSAGGAVRVNIVGVDERFWELGPRTSAPQRVSASFHGNTGDISAVVNTALAEFLGIGPGGEITLQFQTARPLAPDAPFGLQDELATLRLPVEHVADGKNFGDFSLKAEHFAVYNVFVPLKLLQSVNNTPGMAGAVLIDNVIGKLSNYSTTSKLNNYSTPHTDKPPDARRNAPHGAAYEDIVGAVEKSLSIKDAGLNLRSVYPAGGQNGADAEPNRYIEIYSDRIFISDTLKGVIARAVPGAVPVSAWFVNEMRAASGLSTPYSFVSTPPLEYTLSGNRLAIGAWAARDLAVSIGDSVTLTYFVLRPTSGLRIDSSVFAVSVILQDTVAWLDKTLAPPYPGLADAGSCAAWNPSVPIDRKKIRPEDEEYWEKRQGTPKAVISYDKAGQIWSNRFGVCTAVRIPAGISAGNDSGSVYNGIESAIAALLTPRLCGIQLTDVRSRVDSAVSGGADFAPLFLKLGCLAFAAPLLFIWLLASAYFGARAGEHRVLAAAGYSRKHIFMLYVSEGLLVCSVGTLAGILLAPLYTCALLTGLKSVWQAAAMTPRLNLHIKILPVLAGGAAAFACAFAAMSIPVLLAAGRVFAASPRVPRRKRGASARLFDTRRLILLNVAREKRRALCEVIILAGAFFVIGSALLFSQRAAPNPAERSSGTGGFLYYGELNSGIPVEQADAGFLRERGVFVKGNLDSGINDVNELVKGNFDNGINDGNGLVKANIDNNINSGADITNGNVDNGINDGNELVKSNINNGINDGTEFVKGNFDNGMNDGTEAPDFISVAMRMKDGDDASRLNLNRTDAPALLGADQYLLDKLGAFSFASVIDIDGIDKNNPWLVLGASAGDKRTVYGVADASTVERGLGKTLGGALEYIDESGDTLNVVLAASLKSSILQGRVIIAESDFIRHYPSISGCRALLLSMPADLGEAAAGALLSYHEKNGLRLEPAVERLGAFDSAERAHRSIFAVLGMMGLALGCAGMGAVVARGIEERRGELALLMALGFRFGMIKRILLGEQAVIALAGTLLGLVPAVIASGPAFNPTGLTSILCLPAIVFFCGTGSILLALRGLKKQGLAAFLKED